MKNSAVTATLHLMVMGGLCSRFRAVVGASAYCEVTGKRLVVYWLPSDYSQEHGVSPFPAKMSELWDHPCLEENSAARRFPKDREALGGTGDVYLRECHLTPFLPYMSRPILSYIRRFKIKPDVWEMARESVVSMVDHMTVGVVIRWQQRQTRTESVGWFIDRMTQIVELCPGVKFYLAADCRETDAAIFTAFPGRVQAIKHGTDYQYDREGIMRSLADLHILSATDWLVGSRRSSYSQMAAFLRGAERVRSVTEAASTIGGRYEAPDNPAPEGEMLKALGVSDVRN